MNTIFKNSENSKTDKINLRRSDKYVALLNVRIYYTWKNVKESETIKLTSETIKLP